jgi:succinate-acetate transporter protein
MEASQGPREADVAPAPAPAPSAGWSPADPGPLGLAAFAGTTFVLSMINSRLVGGAALPTVFGLTLVYGGLVQILAGMWEFRTGNTFGAVVFTSYGAFWISFYILIHTSVLAIPAKEVSSSIGLWLWMWTIFTFIMLIAALRTAGIIVLVFVLLIITFVFLSIGFSGNSLSTIKIGGYFGIATAIGAWYAAAAGIINSTFGRTVLPLFPLSG